MVAHQLEVIYNHKSYIGHYNPFGLTHGAPEDEVRHVGDMGNVIADANGVVDTTIVDHLIKLIGEYSVIG